MDLIGISSLKSKYYPSKQNLSSVIVLTTVTDTACIAGFDKQSLEVCAVGDDMWSSAVKIPGWNTCSYFLVAIFGQLKSNKILILTIYFIFITFSGSCNIDITSFC